MKIDYLEFQNFASYGNKVQRLEFDKEQSEMFLTLGKNGDGKTTIANSIIFALYGKVDGVKLSDLPNRINKNLLVKIGLWCNTSYVEIERGLAPNKFEVKINNVIFDKAGKRSVQDYLEDEIYGIPYHVFKNIIILSINDFKSFLTMSRSDKKQIIDRMFGFSILNDMQSAIKDERKEVKNRVLQHESELNQIMENIQSVRYKLNTLIEESEEKDQGRINSIKNDLTALNDELKTIKAEHDKVTSVVNDGNLEMQERRDSANQIKYSLTGLKEKLDLYDSGICPTCSTHLTTDWHSEKKNLFKNQIDQELDKIKSLKTEIEEIKEGINSAKNKQHALDDQINNIKYSMKDLKKELISIRESSNGDKFEHLNNLILEFEKSEEEKSQKLDTESADYNFLELVESVLGEDGVKNLAVKTILPGLNANIALMAQTMHLQFQIKFDEKFDCIINHLGEQINPMTLSTGERKKADFIIIIAIIKILKFRYPQLNLLFLDELLSSVDPDGVYNILNILKQVINEQKINTFVINHTVLPHEIFDKKIQIYRENGFSKFQIENIE